MALMFKTGQGIGLSTARERGYIASFTVGEPTD
jgi:hypothetical protein